MARKKGSTTATKKPAVAAPAAPATALARVETAAAAAPALSAGGADFDLAVRMAKALATSTIVPTAYQGKPANVMVAMEYANRLGASVLAVMQNLHVIHGRPSLAGSFMIGTVNASGRFSPIRYRWEGDAGKATWGCRAVATDRETGEECIGPLISIAIARAEGWWSKKDSNGKEVSKWQTIPELMLMYRAGAWWCRVYAPDLSLGLHTPEEIADFVEPPVLGAEVVAVDGTAAPTSAADLAAALDRDDGAGEQQEKWGDDDGEEPPDASGDLSALTKD